MGLETRTKQTISYDYSVNVDDVKSNGDLELTYTYDRIRFNMNMDDIEVSFDSDSATSGDEISKIYKSFIGKQFNVIMTKYGEIKEVKGMDEFLDTLTEPFKSGNTDIFGLDYLNQLKIPFQAILVKNPSKMTWDLLQDTCLRKSKCRRFLDY